MPKSVWVVRGIPELKCKSSSLLLILLLLLLATPPEVLAAFAAGGPLALKYTGQF